MNLTLCEGVALKAGYIQGEEMKVGELAKAANVSVRTLHHYDDIGLLKPSSRTDSGHREYTETDIYRLHKIISLSQIGLSLNEISMTMEKTEEELQKLLDRQLEKVDSEMESLKQKKWMVETVKETSLLPQYSGYEMVLGMIREITIQCKHFAPEDRVFLEKKGKQVGLQRIKEMHERMDQLIKKAQICLEKGVSSSDPAVIFIANEWKTLGEEVFSEDLGLKKRMQDVVRESPEVANYRGLSSELLAYLKEAFHYQEHPKP